MYQKLLSIINNKRLPKAVDDFSYTDSNGEEIMGVDESIFLAAKALNSLLGQRDMNLDIINNLTEENKRLKERIKELENE